MASDAEGDYEFGAMFQEPENYRPPTPEGKQVTYTRNPCSTQPDGPRTLTISLLGTHPLWGHHLWNAAKSFASYLDAHPDAVAGKTVLELGAAGALPSMVAAANRARLVAITDYPDPDLVDNIRQTAEANFPGELGTRIHVYGHRWGDDASELRALTASATFDVLILCDLVFNHSEHNGLLKSTRELLARNGRAFVFFTHHRPWLVDRDLEFLELARQQGMRVERLVEEYTGAMFEDDPGDERVRGTVHGFCLTFC
ncbi:Protein N-terminal and lysine N-methyltransferase efm7 [Coemansia sp. Cherry 401B]|nr:Protein N-terminal and lysine N-methyltransferase efm7 [Coemansia sp. RSA 2705]KAJ2313814.1 Protein N-terminal and lysine N-methyltransferase efm7 [Coemansia sp. RSA 2704]KAJ2714545.1 Protein N-terminal and lysine N-methyltransferase efm7 [Coemansia sp. Cherry 401B]